MKNKAIFTFLIIGLLYQLPTYSQDMEQKEVKQFDRTLSNQMKLLAFKPNLKDKFQPVIKNTLTKVGATNINIELKQENGQNCVYVTYDLDGATNNSKECRATLQ